MGFVIYVQTQDHNLVGPEGNDQTVDTQTIYIVFSNKPIVLFDLILYVPSTIFQLYRDGSSWVEPVLS